MTLKPKLFQFWNTAQAPDEVEALMETWANDPTFDYHRFTTKAADAFIGDHFPSRALSAFRKCGVPAMQADFFRYCALYVFGGVYVDADTGNIDKLHELIDGRTAGLLMLRNGRIANDFMFFRHPRSRLLDRVISTAAWNVENEVGDSVWKVTGPGILTSFYKNESTKQLFDGIDIENVILVRKHVRFLRNLEYKRTGADWRRTRDEGGMLFIKGLDSEGAAR